MNLTVETVALLLLISAVVAILTRRFRLPYSVGLVAAGIGVALLPNSLQVSLTKNLLFTILLPPLIFEAALRLEWKRLRKDLPLVLVLATLGVLLSAAITTVGMHYLASWEWMSALVFGALISATDPVSVIAMFRGAEVSPRLLLLIESESLFNDGTAAVLFAICVAAATGTSVTPFGVSVHLAITVSGSLASGAILALGALLLAGRTDDHLVEITITTVAAYGSFLLAEHFHFSGVVATLVAGIIMGNAGGRGFLTERGREAVEAFWDYAAFVANSLIFLLIGMREARERFDTGWLPIVAAIMLVVISRAAAVYPCCGFFLRSQMRVRFSQQHALFWGGLRGALALALALSLPTAISQRDSIVRASFAVVAFSIFVQGLTLRPLLRLLGEVAVPGQTREADLATREHDSTKLQ